MKKPLYIFAGIMAAFLLLFIFNKISSRTITDDFFAEVQTGEFKITVVSAGELIAEKSIEIKGPDISQGRDIKSSQIKIQDLIPEGTMVNEGDYIATLDRTELSNTLKDTQEYLNQINNTIEMKLLDTAVVLNELRNAIKNQELNVMERELTYRNSRYEPPTVIRQAEINVEQSKRVLDQIRRNYVRRTAQVKTDIYNQNFWKSRIEKRIKDLEEVLAGFTITAPSSGMIIYKREWRGNKRKAGSMINPVDRVVATLPDLSSMISKVYVNEVDISKVQTGQMVDIRVDAFPKKAFRGTVFFVAEIGEKLPNTDDKVFEVQIKINEFDPQLRPSMTTGNTIIIKSYDNVVFIPVECVQAGTDSIPYVYRKDGIKQIIIPGEANDKNMIVEKGLEKGELLYLNYPEKPEKFKVKGSELIPLIRERRRKV